MIHKLLIPMMLLVGALCFAGCVEERNDLEDGGSSGGGSYSGGGGSSSGSGSTAKTYDLYNDDCASMGGMKLSSGACYIPCTTDNDCVKISSTFSCHTGLKHCVSKTYDCDGKPGWIYLQGTKCRFLCNGASDTLTCPSGYKCELSDKMFKDKAGNPRYVCGVKSSSGGGLCDGCGGIFCSGRCKYCC